MSVCKQVVACVGPGMASSSVASPYGADPSLVGMAMAPPPPPYHDTSVQPVSLMPYPSPLPAPAVPSVGSPQAYLDYYSPSAAAQPAQSAAPGGAVYLQPVAPSPEYGGAASGAVPAAAYAGYPCVQYSPMVLSPAGVYSVQAPPAGGRPTLVGPAPGPAYTVPPPPMVVQQSPMETPTAAAVAIPPPASHTPTVQLVPGMPH